jgi:UDP-glucose 4-epimerase
MRTILVTGGFGYVGSRLTSLRLAAQKWLQLNVFFDKSSYGLTEASVFFGSTIYFKVIRIGIECCTFFIDDLKNVLYETDVPSKVTKIHFSQEMISIPNVYICNNWKSIENLIFHNVFKQEKI